MQSLELEHFYKSNLNQGKQTWQISMVLPSMTTIPSITVHFARLWMELGRVCELTTKDE